MIFGQARSRSVLMGLDNHMITSTVPALLFRGPLPHNGHDDTSLTRPANRTQSRNAPGPAVTKVTAGSGERILHLAEGHVVVCIRSGEE